jgi:integrase
LASKIRKQHREGLDPIALRKRARALAAAAAAKEHTLKETFDSFLADRTAGWKGEASVRSWRSEWSNYVGSGLGHLQVSAIGVDDVLQLVRPIWTAKPVLAERLLIRLGQLFDYATGHGWRPAEQQNPAKLARKVLPPHSSVHQVESFAIVPVAEMAGFMGKLRTTESAAAHCIELIALTVVRSSEAIPADWAEFDLDAAGGPLWLVPGHRIKGKHRADHAVPLSHQAASLIKALGPAARGPLFPTLTRSKLGKAFAALQVEGSIHGLRSSFSTWANETRAAAADVIERALTHKEEDDVKAAYDRGDRRHPRALLMQAWGDHCDGLVADNVTRLRAV